MIRIQDPAPGESSTRRTRQPKVIPNRVDQRRRHCLDIDGTWNTRACSINNWPGRREGAPDPLPVIRMRAAQGHQSARWSVQAQLLTGTPGGAAFDPVTVTVGARAADEIEASAAGTGPQRPAGDDPGGGTDSALIRRLHVAVLCAPTNGPDALAGSACGRART